MEHLIDEVESAVAFFSPLRGLYMTPMPDPGAHSYLTIPIHPSEVSFRVRLGAGS